MKAVKCPGCGDLVRARNKACHWCGTKLLGGKKIKVKKCLHCGYLVDVKKIESFGLEHCLCCGRTIPESNWMERLWEWIT